MNPKKRLSASVDASLLRVAESAARRGEARNLSAWVNDALRLKVEHDARSKALGDFIAAFEAEHGEITPEEMVGAARRARAHAVTVRALGNATAIKRKRKTR